MDLQPTDRTNRHPNTLSEALSSSIANRHDKDTFVYGENETETPSDLSKKPFGGISPEGEILITLLYTKSILI